MARFKSLDPPNKVDGNDNSSLNIIKQLEKPPAKANTKLDISETEQLLNEIKQSYEKSASKGI